MASEESLVCLRMINKDSVNFVVKEGRESVLSLGREFGNFGEISSYRT